ncbi:acyl-homoserine-lactone synthase [Loktanella salsilacus]|uniref:acyl-homoserine-lactone synthase n=1 Tax=Loktanella salsilacus TaxID=195913 RepID=UPI003703B375
MQDLLPKSASKAHLFPPLEAVVSRSSLSGNEKTVLSLEQLLRLDLQLRATTLSLINMHHYGELFISYLKARREVFIVAKGWRLPETNGMEFDQYDTPEARWVVVHEFGEVLAGIRISPTTARCGLHSYMIRDAQLGLLDGLALDPLHFTAPVSPHVWEATRLFVSAKVPAARRAEIQTILMLKMVESSRALGITQVIGIFPAVFKRWLKRIGLDAIAVGPKFDLDGDTSQAALLTV